MSGFQKIGTASLSIVPDFDGFVSELRAKLESVRAELDIPVDAELGQFFSALERARERAERTKADLNIGADDAAARAKLDELKAQAARGGDFNLGLDSAQAAAEYLAFKEMVERGADMPIRIRVDRSQLDEIRRLSGSVTGGGKGDIIPNEGDTRRSKNEVNGLADALERLGRVANRNGGISLPFAAPVGISAISAAVVGLTGDLAGLVGMAGAAAGALAAIGSGIGVGFSGVGAALSALKSSPSGASAAVTAKEQAQSLADAQHSVEAAQRAVANATQDTTDKYKAQGEAIRDAGRELRDMNDQLKDAELSQEGAAISAARAEERYQETLAKYRQGRASGLDLQEADFNRRSAQQKLRESQSNLVDQREDTSQANRLGVAGNPKVVAANKAVTDSIQAQKDAQYDLAKAVTALQVAQEKGANGTGGAADKFQEAMAKLSPNAREFVNALKSLGDQWKNTRLATQDALFAGSGQTLKQFVDNQLPAATQGLITMASTANGIAKQSLAELDAQFTANSSNGSFKDFLRATEDSFKGLPNLLVGTTQGIVNMTRIAGPALAGMFSSIGTGINNSSGTFGNLGKHLEEQITRGFEGLPSFMKSMEGPLTAGMDFIGRAFSTFGTILKNNAPELQRLIEALSTDFLPVIQNMGQYIGPALELMTGLLNVMGSFPQETAMALALIFVAKQFASVAGPIATVSRSFRTFRDDFGTAWDGVRNRAALGATAVRDSFNDVALGASGVIAPMRTMESSMKTTAASGVTAFKNLASNGVGVAQSAIGKLSAFIGPGGAFAIAAAAATFVIGEVVAAHQKQAQAAENARAAATAQAEAQRDLNKALADSRGDVTTDVNSKVSQQVANLRREAQNAKDAAPGWAESAYVNTIAALNPGGDTGGRTAQQDKKNNVDRSRAGIAGDSFLQTIDKTKLGNDAIAQAITGSQADFDGLIAKVKAVGDGGDDAAKKLLELRNNFLQAQDAARTLTPGVDALAASMKTLASNTATAEEKSRALQTALDMLAGKAPDKTKALQGYGDAIRSMTDSLRGLDKSKGFGSQLIGKDGSLDVESANGSSALNYLDQVKKSLADLSAAGTLTGEKYDEAVAKMTSYLEGLGVSAEQARVILDKNLGLNDAGRQLLLEVKLGGAKETEQNLQAIKLKLQQENGSVEISPTIATDGVVAELNRVQGVMVQKLSNGNVKITADNAEALQKIQETIDRNVFLDKMKAGPHATLVTDDFIKKYIETQQALDKIDKTKVNPEVAVVMEKFRQGKLETEISLDQINKLRANPAIDADTKAALDKLAALKAEAAKGADLPLRVRLEQDQKVVDQGVAQLYSQPGTQKKLAEQGYNEEQIKRLVAANNGTYVPPEKRASGGAVSGPGSTTSDSIPALLSDEEYIQQASAHRYYGTAFMDALNNKQIPRGALPGFNTGGAVGATQTAEGLNPGADYLRKTIMQMFPQITTIGGRRSEDGYGEHSSGNAIDIMIPNYSSDAGKALGGQVLAFLQQNATALQLDGVIWQQNTYGYGGALTTGKAMSDRGSDTQNHMDHLHVILGKGRGSGAAAVSLPGEQLIGSSVGQQTSQQAAAQKKITELQGQIDALVQGNPDKAEKLADVQKLTTQWAILKEQEKNLTADQQKQMKDYESQLQALYATEKDPSVLQAVSGLTATKRQADKDLAALNTPSSSLAGTTATGTSTTGTGTTSTSATKPTLNASGLSFDGGLTRLGEMFGNFLFPAGSVLNPSGYDKSTTTTGTNALSPAPATNANGTTMPGGPLPTGKTTPPMSIFTPGSGVAGANGLNAFGLPEYTGITPGAALGKLGGIIGGGILSFFGLENSILSSSNPYNQAIQKGAVEGWRAWGPNTPGTSTTGTGNVGAGDPSDPRTAALLNGTPAGTSGTVNVNAQAGGIPLVQNPDGTWTSSNPEWAKLIKRESGGKANIVQGVADANSGGNEASGLFQIAKGTWAGAGGTKYAPTAGQATPQQQAEIAAAIFKRDGGAPWGAGLAGRESVDLLRAGLYDDGGYLQPGTTLVHNETGKPEPVFTAPQWQTIQGAVDAAQNPPAPQAQQVQNTAQQLSPEIPGVIGQGKGSGANGSVTGAITGGLSNWAGGLLDQGAGSIGSIVSGIGGAAGGAAGGPLAGVAGGASFAAGGAKLGMDIASKAATKFVSSLGSGLGLGGSEVANLFQMTQIGKNTGIDGAPVQGGKTQPPTVNSGQQGGLQIGNLTVTSPDEFVDTVNRREQQQSQAALATAPR